jgi:uncharacterized protein YbaR (Trm112 family)
VNSLAQRLRTVILDIRRKPYPIKDLIPLLAEAARYIEENPSKPTGEAR